MNTKYEFVKDDTIVTANGVTLTRIRALRDIPKAKVKAGDLGGYLQSEKNLSADGDCWVGYNARVFGEAMVFGNACVSGKARISGYAKIFDEALVFGDAQVSGEALVFGKAVVLEGARIFGKAVVLEGARIFGKAVVLEGARISGNASIFGSARVSGRKTRVYEKAQIFGDARVFGNARVLGEACVYGEARVYGEASISTICIPGFRWIITITDKHMRIGCQFHEIEAWDSFTDREIAAMDGKHSLRFWRENKDGLIALARAHAKRAVEAKSKVQ